MKRSIITILALTLLLTATSAFAAESFPDLTLNGKLTAVQKEYLGVTSDSFKVSDIKADYLFIEAYSMYCPICQRDAPRVNEIYDKIGLTGRADRIKFIGLGMGNTSFEIAFYQKKFNVPFPLFEDENYVIHKALGEVGTPTFYLVKVEGKDLKVLYTKTGEAEDKDALLKVIMDKAGLN